MAGVYTTAGEINHLTRLLTQENVTLKLYTACATAGGLPTVNSIPGDFTEAVFSGYAAKTLTGTISGSTWSTPAGIPAKSQYNPSAPQVFTATAGYQTIKGYTLTGATSGVLLVAESFVASGGVDQVLSVSQPSLNLIPQWFFGSTPAPTS